MIPSDTKTTAVLNMQTIYLKTMLLLTQISLQKCGLKFHQTTKEQIMRQNRSMRILMANSTPPIQQFHIS